jgi:hypothetical protein
MRVGNVLELTADACGRALLMALLVFLPAVPARGAATPPALSSAQTESPGVQEEFHP